MSDPTFAAVRQTLDAMVKYQLDGFQIHPECALFAKAVLDEMEAAGMRCPQLLPEPDCGITLTFHTETYSEYWSICPEDIDVYILHHDRQGVRRMSDGLLEKNISGGKP